MGLLIFHFLFFPIENPQFLDDMVVANFLCVFNFFFNFMYSLRKQIYNPTWLLLGPCFRCSSNSLWGDENFLCSEIKKEKRSFGTNGKYLAERQVKLLMIGGSFDFPISVYLGHEIIK
eukprot:GDKJ01010048.1.p1 GENE.GDKJ01010048.1~~GDKJ01010048.1.p1  ORF type:complete len:118 (+),score=1.59 GDKJ01010048.1:117-470(+)